ncbi:homer protein homolog 1 [Folsomia candida]|uniref:homer protein homolog 1 n=1 Tax=Folsomia candida TaxID=158441 RepID=UPI00160554BF|nr:homer protein homolog 1 [Folsomia candida]
MYSNSIIGRDNATPTNNNNASEGNPCPPSDDPATLIHTSFAKVYTMTISPTPKTWTPATQYAVPVSFYFDKQRNVYRILSYDGERLIINSTIVPSMSFNKPSSAFGLWSDTKLRIIFGLGFPSQGARDLAGDWFDKLVKAATNLEQSSRNLTLPPPETGMNNLPFSAATSVNHWITDDESALDISSTIPPAPPRVTSPSQALSCPPHQFSEEYTPDTDRVVIAVGGAIREQSIKSLQQEEELERKLVAVEKELSELKVLFASVQENLGKKIKEAEKLRELVNSAKEELQVQINRAEIAEKLHKEEKQRMDAMQGKIEQLKAIISQQTGSIAELQEGKRVSEQENKILRESLNNRFNVEEADKDLSNLESMCREISEKMGEVLKIQERLKNNLAGAKQQL